MRLREHFSTPVPRYSRRTRGCGSRFLSAQGADGITLATRDRRAAETYRALDIDFELIQ